MPASDAEERRARSDRIGEAIAANIEHMELRGMLGDWMIVGSSIFVDEDGDPNAQYFVVFSGGSMLQHTALGLLRKGQNVLESGTDDEEE